MALTGITGNIAAQTTVLYTQSFGTGSSFPSGWTASGAQSGNLTVNTASTSTGYTLPSGNLASGGSNVADGNSTPTVGTCVLTVAGVISTVGASTIKVAYGARKTNAYTGSIVFEWSSDGITWNTISFTDVTNNSTWKAINGGTALTLPAGANNQANLRFRWTFTRTNTSGNYRIDDFTVYTGTLATPVFTELAIPQYLAGNQSSGSTNGRTAVAVCFQIDNLLASTLYNVRIGFTASGAASNATFLGNIWSSSAFNTASSSYISFTTTSTGSSGPVWAILQESGNAAFNPGGTPLVVRFIYSTTTTFGSNYNFQTTATIAPLDAGASTTYSAGTTDDGAYLKISSSSSFSGKYFLSYNNTAGTGYPLFSYQARTATATQATQSQLPTAINDIYLQSGTSASGDAPQFVPIGANNPNGVRRIEIRNADNSIFAYFTRADGIWNDGAATQNTTTIARAAVQTISLLKGTFDDVGIYSALSQAGSMTVTGALDASAALTIGTNTLTLNGTVTANTGTLTGSTTSNLSIGGSSGGNVGTLNFTSGSRDINIFTMNRSGGSGDAKAVLGTDLTTKSLTLTNGIVVTGNNLFTWDNSGTLTSPNTPWAVNQTNFTNSYICTCDDTGTPLSTTNGTKGFRINSVGSSTDTYFPVGADFTSANRMMLNNAGTTDDFTVVVGKGDIGHTPKPRISRIWYVTEGTPGGSQATMRLFFKKYDDPSGFPIAQNEVEAGFLNSDVHLVQETATYQYINNATGTDVQNFVGSATNGTEIYGLYTRGISTNIDNTANPNGITQFSRFAVVNASGVILPVTIGNLEASLQGTAIRLGWTSIAENNIDHYEIERAADGMSFISIGTKTATNNGSLQTNYVFIDALPYPGLNYYRIKWVEKDGNSHYSAVVLITTGEGKMQVKLLPNPVVNKTATLMLSDAAAGKYQFALYNTTAKQVWTRNIDQPRGSSSYTLYFPASLSAGIYYLHVTGEASKFVQKIIIY